jgi:hypothetical protein
MRNLTATAAGAAALLAFAAPAEAQDRNRRQIGPGASSQIAQQAMQGADQPDVLLDIPNLSIDEIGIKGVQAQATLVVRLGNVRAIIERTLQTLDNNPQLVTQLLSTVDSTVNTVGGVANNTVGTVGNIAGTALRSGQVLDLARTGLTEVSRTVNTAGQTVRRVRDGGGLLMEVVTDAAGRIVSSRRVTQ